ncbi:MAG: alkaline shock response membrane anchor protein AmaP [bacterium]
MRALFVLIGLLFDVIIFVVSAFLIYSVFRPELFSEFFDAAAGFLDDTTGRIEIFAGAVVFLILSLRGLFLLIFGRGEKAFVLSKGEGGVLTATQATLDHVLEGIVREKAPQGKFAKSSFRRRGEQLSVTMNVQVDLLHHPVQEFTQKLNQSVREHFRDFLGIELETVDVRVENLPTGKGA